MCGFVVIAQQHGRVPAHLLGAMVSVLGHRGPDGQGVSITGSVGMQHQRLAILDPVGGAQPMARESVSLVFNGEIYNAPELRLNLQGKGYQFTTQSDTEVLLVAYLAWGQAAVEKLNGMFAFVLHDQKRNRVLAARDAFGVKPLYRVQVGQDVIYASEIKALLQHPGVQARLNPVALEDYLSLQLVMGGNTLFEGIEKVEPACLEILSLQTMTFRQVCYWALDFESEPSASDPAATRELIRASVLRQMQSDVPVGAMLSGGLDSSTVAALAAENLSQTGQGSLHAFTGAFDEGPAFDESMHARRVADHIGAIMHTTYPNEHQFVDQLSQMVWAMDEPMAGPGMFAQFIMAQAAREHVQVYLGGQGGDELFVGYARYVIGALQETLGASVRGDAITRNSLSLSQLEPGLGGLASYEPLMRRVLGAGLKLPGHQRYFQIMNRLDGQSRLLSAAVLEQMHQSQVAERFESVFERPKGASHLKKMMHFDLTVNLPALLHVEDRASMTASVEARVPLLDTDLAQHVVSLPDRVLLDGGFSKSMLRAAAKPWLPAAIVNRTDKMGFPVPLQRWMKGPTREFVRDTLLSQRARERGLFDTIRLAELIDREADFGRGIWGALQLELWHQQFIDGTARLAASDNANRQALTV
ncbi:MAG: asparagine synthase (glutamine-hydrolyzing) [Burkholderiaceae bacterium]